MREKEHVTVPILLYRQVQKKVYNLMELFEGFPDRVYSLKPQQSYKPKVSFDAPYNLKTCCSYLFTHKNTFFNEYCNKNIYCVVLILIQIIDFYLRKRNSIIQLIYYNKGYGFIIILRITTLLLVIKSLKN